MSADHIATVRAFLPGRDHNGVEWEDEDRDRVHAALDALAADLEQAQEVADAWRADLEQAERWAIGEVKIRMAAEARVEQLEAALRKIQAIPGGPPVVAARGIARAALAPNGGGESVTTESEKDSS